MGTVRVTIRDVAEAANVSLTAVSFYLNKKPGLSEVTRERIAAAIETLGYVPRGLAATSGSLSFIGLLIERLPLSPFADLFYGGVIQGIESRARSLGYNVALMTVEARETIPQLIQQHGTSLVGMIILGGGDFIAEVVENVVREELPAIMVDHDTPDLLLNSIMPDYVRGAYDATRYLIQQGYTRIGCIQGPSKYRSLVERFHGHVAALVDAGLEVDTSLIQSSISTGLPNKGYREMLALLERRPDVEAVFCVSDRTAFGAIDALRSVNQRVPEDIAIVGFDNVAQASQTSPPLTTVDVSKYELGLMAMDLLHVQIPSPELVMPTRTLLPTRLVIRASA